MNSASKRLRAQMMVALDDADAIETRPIEAVNADLERLGVDPSGCTALARSLSQSKKAPAGRLLDRLEEADDIAAEIDSLERVGIDEVRMAVPGGKAAAIAADAKRRAGQPSNVTPFKRWRLPVLGAGSSLMAIAACLVLFVAIRPDQLDRTEPQAVQEADVGVSVDDLADQAFVEEERASKERPESSAIEQRSFARSSAAERERPDTDTNAAFALGRLEEAVDGRRQAAMPDTTSKSAPNLLPEGVRQMETVTVAPSPSEAPPLPKAMPVQPSPAGRDEPAARIPEQTAVQHPWETGAVGLPDDITALFVVEPDQMPAALEAKAYALPDGDLGERLPQATDAVGARTIVALISFMREGETIDAAVVMGTSALAPMALNTLAEPAPTLDDPFHQDFLLIELPELRD